MRLNALMIVLTAWAATASAGDYAAAGAKAERYRAEAQALAGARAQNAAEAVKQHGKQAHDLLQEAIKLYEEAGVARASDAAVVEDYANLLAANGDFDLAADALKRMAAREPGNAGLWAKLGENLGKVGPQGHAAACEAFRKSLELDRNSPGAARAYFALGELQWRQGLYELAQENVEAGLTLAPDDVRGHIAQSALKARSGRVLESSKELDAVGKAAQPYDAETRALLRQALADFDAARRSFEDTAENHAAYARLLYRAARVPEAILAAQRATRLNPKDFETLNFMGAMQNIWESPCRF